MVESMDKLRYPALRYKVVGITSTWYHSLLIQVNSPGDLFKIKNGHPSIDVTADSGTGYSCPTKLTWMLQLHQSGRFHTMS